MANGARSALNAVLGEYLEERGNPLAIRMQFYDGDAPMVLSAPALAAVRPALGARLVVFVHGMAQTEACWSFPGEPGVDYGSLLRAELGLTPLYVRYNTGRHVSHNGRELAAMLEQLVLAAPEPIAELSLVGHSLGGLVIRSACHYANELGLGWVQRTRRALYLGTPHLGSPLEKAGSLVSAALGAIDDPVVRLIHALAELRGAGVKDLRHGSLLDEDSGPTNSETRVSRRPRVVPLHAGMAHYFVASTLTRNTEHWAALLLGDALVRVGSATAPGHRAGLAAEHMVVLPALSHMQLCRSPEVYAAIRAWFGASAPAAERAAVSADVSAGAARTAFDLAELDAYRALVEDAVDRGATAIQEIHEAFTARPYRILERVPGLGTPAKVVGSLHSKHIETTYDAVRAVNRGVGALVSAGLSGWRAAARRGSRPA